MKNFLANVFYFGLCVLSLNIALYFILYQIYLKPYQSVNLNYQCYLLSDSHGIVLSKHLDPFGIYNFSAPSDSYHDMFLKLKYLKKKSEISVLLLTVDDHTLSPYRDKLNNSDRSLYFNSSTLSNMNFSIIRSIFKRYFVLLNTKDCLIIRNLLKSKIINILNLKKKSKKWTMLSNYDKNLESLHRFNEQFAYKQRSTLCVYYLHQIIDYCKRNNIYIVGIKFPLSRNYIGVLKQNSYNADLLLLKKNYEVYDFKYQYYDKDEYFYDQDHLNDIGAMKFSKIIGRIIKDKFDTSELRNFNTSQY